MLSIQDYNLLQNDWVHIKSKVCGVGASLEELHRFTPLGNRISELTMSYFNQWRFVIEAYDKLFIIFKELNSTSDQQINERIITDFDIKALQSEIEFKNYSFLFIVSLKSLLDIFTCIVDIIQNQKVRTENKMPDFFSYGNKGIEKPIEDVRNEFEKLRERVWIKQVNSIQNKIIHRGYLLKPVIGFHKEEKLIVHTYKGADFYVNVDIVDLGCLFGNFITEMSQIDDNFANILGREILMSNVTHEASFRFSELLNEYIFREISPN